MAYVNVTRQPEESPEEARRRRRYELARGWKFACQCSRCLESGKPEELSGVTGDHSKVDQIYSILLQRDPSTGEVE